VSPQNFLKALFERGVIERAFEPEGDGDVVGRDAGLELIEKPESLLSKRQRPRSRSASLRDRTDGLVGRNANAFFLQQRIQQLHSVLRQTGRLHLSFDHLFLVCFDNNAEGVG